MVYRDSHVADDSSGLVADLASGAVARVDIGGDVRRLGDFATTQAAAPVDVSGNRSRAIVQCRRLTGLDVRMPSRHVDRLVSRYSSNG